MLRRLLASGLAYQSPAVISGVLAIGTLRLYTEHLSQVELGRAEGLLVWIILVSIVVRAGLQEAFLRTWFSLGDPLARVRLARRVLRTTLVASTVAALAVLLAAPVVAEPLLGPGATAGPVRAAALGLWAFSNLEMLNALLRAQEARRLYFLASLGNVLLTAVLTIVLVVGFDGGATGYLLGNYVASVVVALGIAFFQRDVLLTAPSAGAAPLGPLVRFGLATIPAELGFFALNVIDRTWLLHTADPGSAGLYAGAAKLATLVIVLSRALQAAWPPLAYALPDAEAPRGFALALRASLLGLGGVVVGLILLRVPLTNVLLSSEFGGVAPVLPWVALAWALWGLMTFVSSVANRGRAPSRSIAPALLGLVVNLIALALLVPAHGAAGAGAALVLAYVAMLGLGAVLTRRLVPIAWGEVRLVRVLGSFAAVVGVAFALGVDGNRLWAALLLCLAVPCVLRVSGAVDAADVRWARGLLRARGSRVA